MKNAVLALALMGTLIVSGCGESDEQRARDLAVSSCGITFDDSTGAAVFDDSEPNTTDPSRDSIAKLREVRDVMQGYARDAAAASQLDPRWSRLSEATQDVYSVKQRALQVRQEAANEFEFWELFSSQDVERHNNGLAVRRTECSALASLL